MQVCRGCGADHAHFWPAVARTPQNARVHAHQPQEASRNRQLDFDNDEMPAGEGQGEKKVKAPRVLDALDCVGLGDGTDEGDLLSDLARTPRACVHARTEGSYFERRAHLMQFAQHFGIPFTWEDYAADCADGPEALRGERRHFADETSEVMFALTAAHPEKSLLDVNNEGVSETALPQFHGDVLSNTMLHGAMGGVEGLSTLSLWCVGMDSVDVPPFMLKAVELIVKASRGHFPDSSPIWPCVPTRSSLPMSTKRTVVGGRYRTKTDFHELQAKQGLRMVDDLHPKLRERIAEYRGVAVDDVVAPHREYKGVSAASGQKECVEGYEPIERELFKMHLLQGVHKGVLADGEEANVVTTEIRLLSSFPGSCMFLLLQQMMECMQDLKTVVHRIWQHNKLVLKNTGSLSCEDMFSRKDDMNAYKLCCAGCIPLAAHTLALASGVRALDCFPVVDVADGAQLRLYHAMLDEAAARNEFLFHRVGAAVSEKIVAPDFELDVAATDTRGWHVRWKHKSVLLRTIEEAKEHEASEWQRLRLSPTELAECLGGQRRRWEAWLEDQLQDDARVYFVRLGYYPALGGTVCRINPNYVPARDDRKRKEEAEGRPWELPDPRGMSALVRTYFPIRLEPRVRNNMHRFYEDAGLVADLHYLKAHLDHHLPNQVLSLFHALEKEAATEMFRKKHDLSTREVCTNELLGRNERHPVYVHLQNNEQATALCDRAGVDFKTIRVCLQTHIENMVTGDLLQWAQVGEVLRSLKKLGGMDWPESMADFVHSVRERQHPLLWPRVPDPRMSPVVMLGGALAVLYNESAWKNINEVTDLSGQSRACAELFQYSICGMFLWSKMQPGWGYPTWMTDGGGSYHVLNEKGLVQRTDNKTPGAGADVIKNATEDMNKVFPLHCCGHELARLHAQGLDMDTKYQESPLQMAKDTGTACERDHAGRVVLDSNVHTKLGTVVARTEIGKMAKREDAGDMLANSENTMGHSGTDRGDLVLWITHMAGKPLVLVQVAVSSVFIMCGNNLTGAQVPASLSQTGRAKFVSSPSALVRGIIACQRTDSRAENRYLKKRKVVLTRQLQCVGKAQRKPPNICDKPGVCVANMPFFWVKWLVRRGFCFLGKGFLTGGQCFSTHTMFAWDTVSHVVQVMTRDARRLNLANADDWSRSFDGPCKTAVLQGLWANRMATAYTIQAVLDPVDAARVDLPTAYENLVLAYMRLPVDLASVLTALYVYLNMCVLDFNLMVLSCYLTHTMGVQQHCSLVTIALVMSGFHDGLDETQQAEYANLCEFLLPVVTTPGTPGTQGTPGPYNHYSALMPRHWLVPTQELGLLGLGRGQDKSSVEMLERWCSFDNPGLIQQGLHEEIRRQTERFQAVAPGRSTYLMNTVSYAQTVQPAWVRHRSERQSHSRHSTGREEITTGQMAAAAVFGEQHTRAASAARATGAPDFQNTVLFFDHAKDGARFPSNSRNKEKDINIRFVPNEETATWWNTTIENAGTLEGLLLPFLQMCGASLSASRHELVSRLLAPYMRKHNLSRAVCRDHAWLQPVFAKQKMQAPAFAVGIQPRMQGAGPNTHTTPSGVDVNLGVDVLAFLLLQGLYAQCVHRTSVGHNSVVHHCNNQTAALGILEIMLHTHVPLCEVPVSGGSCRRRNCDAPTQALRTGRVVLHDTSPVPLREHTPAFLNFDARLHIDACVPLYEENLEDETTREYCADVALSSVVREPGKWVYVTVRQCASAGSTAWMYLGTVCRGLRPESQGDIFPFPVESVAHMQGAVHLLRPAYKQACDMFADNLLEFARTVRVFLSSVESYMLSYLWPLTMTHCAARDEVPCIAWLEVDGKHDAFLFTLTLYAEHASIVAVEPTHQSACVVSRHYGLQPMQPLPMPSELVHVAHGDLQSVLRAGLVYDAGTVHVRKPGSARSGHVLPTMMFPVINYPTYVTLQCERQHLEVQDASGRPVRVAYVSLHAVVLSVMPFELGEDERAAWLAENPTIASLLGETDELVVFGVDVSAESSVTGLRWGPRCKFLLCRTASRTASRGSRTASRTGGQSVCWCNNIVHLRWCLENTQWDFLDNSTHMICENCDFEQADGLSNEFWPVGADMRVRMMRVDSALSSVRDALSRQLLHAERLLGETRARVDALSTAEQSAETDALLSRHRGVLALRNEVVSGLQDRLSQMSHNEVEFVVLSLAVDTMADAKVVHKTFEPFVPGSGAQPLAACLEAWDLSEHQSMAEGQMQFLLNGHYRLRLPTSSSSACTEFHDIPMDFVSASRCMWVEGQPLFLDVGPAEYAQIMALFPGMRAADPKLHALLTRHDAMERWHELNTHVQFQCHYVLSHGSRVTQMQHVEAQGDAGYWDRHPRKHILQMGVQLLLPVQTCSADTVGAVYNDRDDNQYMIRARLYVDGEMRVHPYPREAGATSRVILCDLFEYKYEYASVDSATDATVDPGESAVWYHAY